MRMLTIENFGGLVNETFAASLQGMDVPFA